MKYNEWIIIVLLYVTTVFQACTFESEYDKQVKRDDEIIRNYLFDNEIGAEKTSKGLYYLPLVEDRSGDAASENKVISILYSMKKLPGGELVEMYSDTLNPVMFKFTPGSIVPEVMNHAVSFMHVGEEFRFFIPSYRAFGEYAHESMFEINSNFILDVTLVNVQSESERNARELELIDDFIEENELDGESFSSGLFLHQIKEGTGGEPYTKAQVRFHYTRKYLDGEIIASSRNDEPILETLDQGNLAKGLEQGLKNMKQGGEALMILPSEIAFGKSVQVIPRELREDWVENGNLPYMVLPYTPIIYEIELFEVH